MILILNIETSADYCSVSLADTGKIIDTLIEKEERSHASLLAVSIEKLIKRNNLSIQNLNAVAISQGPGSYTGLRIGTSTAKGICYGLNIPLIAIDTLKAMSWGAKQKLNNIESENEIQLCPMLDARRMEIYTALYDFNLNTISEARPVILDEETVQEFDSNSFVFFGSGIEKFKTLVNIDENRFINELVPTSDYLAELSFSAFQNQEFVDTAYFEPFYLKEFVATTPKRKVL
jgi:tRNA threonylcarbamoyladenosine biosynthesis protein TsaB